jgi:hypothetical protein
VDMAKWKGINKCMICGAKLKFDPAAGDKGKHGEGKKYCEQNHPKFIIFGQYAPDDEFQIKLMLPGGKKYTTWTV